MPIPFLILSDSPTAGTGLGRVACDIATRIARCMPETFRVATLGYGGQYSSKLPFPQYSIDMKDWVVYNLPDVWEDFARDEDGILFTIWDASRLQWLSRPENCEDRRLRKFLDSKPFKKFAYLPMDATGPHDRLTFLLKHTIEGFDRVLAYSEWAEGILRRTITSRPILDELTWLPHGIDFSVFQPRQRTVARHGFGERINGRNRKGKWLSIPDDHLLIGIVATNQIRKDYGLGIQAVAEVMKHRSVWLWIHIDDIQRHWCIASLLNDYGIENHLVTNIKLTDEQMSWSYSACDVTLGIGAGEGYGYPLAESLACGTPVIHGNYGGGAWFVPEQFRVEPKMYRIEGIYNCVRPVFDPHDWAEKILSVGKTRLAPPATVDWNVVWMDWKRWLAKGAECLNHS